MVEEENKKNNMINDHHEILKKYMTKLPIDLAAFKLFDDYVSKAQGDIIKLFKMNVAESKGVSMSMYIFFKLWTQISLIAVETGIKAGVMTKEQIAIADNCAAEMYQYYMKLKDEPRKSYKQMLDESGMPEELKKALEKVNPDDILTGDPSELAEKVMNGIFGGNKMFEVYKAIMKKDGKYSWDSSGEIKRRMDQAHKRFKETLEKEDHVEIPVTDPPTEDTNKNESRKDNIN